MRKDESMFVILSSLVYFILGVIVLGILNHILSLREEDVRNGDVIGEGLLVLIWPLVFIVALLIGLLWSLGAGSFLIMKYLK